jgi:glycosyltransferase involved in cell wall biosynthesis
MKIAVYAISKNEEKHVKRFCDSAKDADLIVIADTGSEDKTVEIAKECGAQVYEITVVPWRFDKARDTALALVPRDVDVCVSMDLDEVLKPGWRDYVERIFGDGHTRLSFGFDAGNGLIFYPSRIHARMGYHWKYPCHEYITPDPRMLDKVAHTNDVLMEHHPDPTKSRGSYLDLLQFGAKNDPSCYRMAYYLGREYTYHQKWKEAITELQRYLTLPNAIWSLERSHAMRMIGGATENLNEDGLKWFRLACAEAPEIRENWYELAYSCYKHSVWAEGYAAAKTALGINNNLSQHTRNAAAWGYLPHDILALCAYNLKLKDEAVKHGEIAVEMAPEIERLKTNLKFYKDL